MGALLATAACSAGTGTDGNESAGGSSVPPGAPLSDYAAALSDMEPVELTMQVSGAKGDLSSQRFEEYAAVVEEGSDGKITFEIVYGNAIAGTLDTDDALADGRLDLAVVLGLYEPDLYPATNALVDQMTLTDTSVVGGTLQANAAMLESAFAYPEIREEYADEGVHLLLPMFAGDSIDLMCAEPASSLADLNGRQTRVASESQAEQVKALGMTPVSMAFTEIFEALQRGIVDCAVTSLTVAETAGLVPVAKHLIIDAEVGWGRVPFGIGVDAQAWADLPVAAQQLLHDRLDVFIESGLLTAWERTVEALKAVEQEGGSFSPLDSDAREALQKANEQVRTDVGENAPGDGEALVQQVSESSDEWWQISTGELGYDGTVGAGDFVAWYAENDIDLTAYVDRLRTEVLDEHRPGN